MVKFLIKRPIAVIMSFVAFLVLGLISTQKLPISLMPNVSIPEITIHISQPGMSASQLEQSVVSSFRRELMQVPGLDDITSQTRDNYSIVRMNFKYGTKIDYAYIEVNDKIDAAMSYMPRTITRPRVIKASASDIPAFYINVSLKNDSTPNNEKLLELSEFTSNVIKKRIEQLPEVALADISGLVFPEISITPLKNNPVSINLTPADIQAAFHQNNIQAKSILIRQGNYQYLVQIKSQILSVTDIQNILIKKSDRVFKLGDLADVKLRTKNRDGLFLDGKSDAITMSVIKHSSAKMSVLKDNVNDLLNAFQTDYPQLRFKVTRDQTQLLSYSITNLKQSLIIGCILAIIIMFFFLKNPRSPLLIAFSIPVSLVISLLFFMFANISINIISLSGLILGVGMMIDNSIIVIDNITQYIDKGDKLTKAVTRGTTEVIRPLISSVLTTCSVFIPLVFLSGISGALFFDQAVSVSIGLIVSLIVSVTLLPVLYKLFNSSASQNTKHWGFFDIEKYYEKGFDKFFKYRRYYLAFFLCLPFVAIWLFNIMPKQQMPTVTQTETLLYIDWNQNIHVDKNREQITKLLNYCNQTISQSNCYIGEQQFILNKDIKLKTEEALLYIKTPNAKQLAKLKKQVNDWLVSNYPNATFAHNPPENVFEKLFGKHTAPLQVNISSVNQDALPNVEAIEDFKSKIDKITGTHDSNLQTTISQTKILLLLDKVLLYEVNYNQLLACLNSAFGAFNVGEINSQNSFIPVVLGTKINTIENILNGLYIANANNCKIPVNSLIKTQQVSDYETITAGKTGSYIPVNININQKQIPNTISEIRNILPADLMVDFKGSYFQNKKLIMEMTIVLLISLLLLYFILAAQFESLTQPLIVLLEVPIDMAAALGLLYLFGGTINLMAMIGIIVMAGIIINDSILKIDTINKLRQSGYSVMEAIRIGGHRRLKPILMTSLTTILALVPFFFGHNIGVEIQRPLAITLIGGMVLGTYVSLFFIPLLYYYLSKIGDKHLEVKS